LSRKFKEKYHSDSSFRESLRERNVRWNCENKERRKAYTKAKYATRDEEARKYAREYHAKHRDAANEQCRAWRQKNPEKVLQFSHKRRAALLVRVVHIRQMSSRVFLLDSAANVQRAGKS